MYSGNHIEQERGCVRLERRPVACAISCRVCKDEDMPVVIRIGPFCHGEARNGGIPDWFFTKGIKSRSETPEFFAIVERLYRQIFTQIQGMQWKDGGPVMACQFDNEYRGHGSYLMALKRLQQISAMTCHSIHVPAGRN